ncbi:MAG: hypothetical protein LBR22_00780 [Desulfovibrio sp.]|jgi:hypothetical protein|nr:hypothetical protein [Desulfovibrio sp.]
MCAKIISFSEAKEALERRKDNALSETEWMPLDDEALDLAEDIAGEAMKMIEAGCEDRKVARRTLRRLREAPGDLGRRCLRLMNAVRTFAVSTPAGEDIQDEGMLIYVGPYPEIKRKLLFMYALFNARENATGKRVVRKSERTDVAEAIGDLEDDDDFRFRAPRGWTFACTTTGFAQYCAHIGDGRLVDRLTGDAGDHGRKARFTAFQERTATPEDGMEGRPGTPKGEGDGKTRGKKGRS